MASKESTTKEAIFYDLHPEISKYLEKGGVSPKTWIGIIGEPSSGKSIMCMSIAYRWLIANPKNNVIYVATEHDTDHVLTQAQSLNIPLEKYVDTRLVFGSTHAKKKNEYIENTYVGLNNFVKRVKLENFVAKLGGWEAHTLLIIDSMASFWEDKPASSRRIWTQIYSVSKSFCDLAIVTAQLAIGTGKSFGFGVEHGVDSLIRVGNFTIDGEGRRWIYIEKMRGMNHERRIREFIINDKTQFLIGDPVKLRGRYGTVLDAIENLKLENSLEVQENRNEILSALSGGVGPLIALFSKMAKSIQTLEEKVCGKKTDEKKDPT